LALVVEENHVGVGDAGTLMDLPEMQLLVAFHDLRELRCGGKRDTIPHLNLGQAFTRPLWFIG